MLAHRKLLRKVQMVLAEMTKELEDSIKELKAQLLPYDIWDDIPQGDFPLSVGHEGKFEFSIRPREHNHFQGHFHVKAGSCSGSYLIKPVVKRDGNFSSRDNKIIIAWGEKNQEKLIKLWNKIHPDKEL